MIKAVFFDFDGTLADTISAIWEGINLLLEELRFPLRTAEEIRGFINHGPRELVRRSLPEKFQRDDRMIDDALERYNVLYQTVFLHTERTYEGMDILLQELHKTVKIGVLSNKQDGLLKELCKKVLLPGSYDGSLGSRLGFPSKPDVSMTETLATRLGVKPSECLMVGDSDVDIQTAINGGMQSIAVSWGYRDAAFLKAHGADRIASSVQELKAQIRFLL